MKVEWSWNAVNKAGPSISTPGIELEWTWNAVNKAAPSISTPGMELV